MTTDLNKFLDGLLAKYNGQPGATARVSMVPLSVTFCIDGSGSMLMDDIRPNRFGATISAVQAFIGARQCAGAVDLVSAVVFDSSATIISGLVPIHEAERRLLQPLRRVDAGGGTQITKGLLTTETILATSPHGNTRFVVLLSDGEDGGEPYYIADRMKAAGAIINCIGIGRRPADVDEACLKRVCSTVDGDLRYRFISNAKDLATYFETLATGLTRVQ